MYRRILLAIDGSRCSFRALEQAVAMALATRAEVCAVVVADDADPSFASIPGNPPWLMADVVAYGEGVLSQAGERLSAAGVRWSSRLMQARGTPAAVAEAIVGEAERWSADVIVMGTHGHRGVRRILLGSVSERVVCQTARPVMLVRDVSPRRVA